MKNTILEVLVILASGNVGHVVSQFQGVVTQAVSDRIAVVSLPANSVTRLEELDSVDSVITGGKSPMDLSGLTDEEKLFVSAWVSRKTEHEKQRGGDGLDWDASGFSSP